MQRCHRRSPRLGKLDGRRLALRLDDVGASTKKYEVYSNRAWHLGPLRLTGNLLFLKYLPPFKAWGPYEELSAQDWLAIFHRLECHAARITVAITAAWVESADSLVPFPDRFPHQASLLREGLQEGLVEIANHGLTHCVLADNAFKPRWFASNRAFHREFWDWIPREEQEDHIRRSQDILETFFKTEIVTFVPPGNVFTSDTLEIAGQYGLRYVSCNAVPGQRGNVRILGERDVVAFHDRDIVCDGTAYLDRLVQAHPGRQFCTVRDLAEVPATA